MVPRPRKTYILVALLLIILISSNVNHTREIAVLRKDIVASHEQFQIERDQFEASNELFDSANESPEHTEHVEVMLQTSNELIDSDISGLSEHAEMLPGEEAINKRMQHIGEVCEAKGYPDFNSYKMYHFKELKITWIPVFKASSTNWKLFFIDRFHPDHTLNYHLDALIGHILGAKENRKASNGRLRTFSRESRDSIRFTIVRHPLSRLVSHYRKTVTTKSQMKALGNMWVKHTILHARHDSRLNREYGKELDKWLMGTFQPREDSKNPYLTPPTFPEFINWLLYARKKRDWRGGNAHWRPASHFTDICQNNIDIVVKLENEEEEVPYLLKRLNLSEYLEYFMGTHNSSGKKEVQGTDVEDFIGQLSEDNQKQLNKIYELDYEIFGYSPVYV